MYMVNRVMYNCSELDPSYHSCYTSSRSTNAAYHCCSKRKMLSNDCAKHDFRKSKKEANTIQIWRTGSATSLLMLSEYAARMDGCWVTGPQLSLKGVDGSANGRQAFVVPTRG